MTLALLEEMRAALDAHDLDTFVGFFHDDYVGERPRYPDAAVSTRADVRRNWEEVIRDVPDLRVEVPAAVLDGERIWTEWRAYGTSRSGAALELRGVFIFGLRDGRVAWSRMYFEPVEQAGSPLPGFLAVPLPPPLE